MKEGFPPVFDGHSRVLILGSFPSVKSRALGFYYGNPQNRFWGMLSRFFGDPVPLTAEGKRAYVLGHGVALWDVVTRCEIEGSADSSIRAAEIGDVAALERACGYLPVFCNGSKSYSELGRNFPELLPLARRLPSTSPANPRYDETAWHSALAEVFGGKPRGFLQKS